MTIFETQTSILRIEIYAAQTHATDISRTYVGENQKFPERTRSTASHLFWITWTSLRYEMKFRISLLKKNVYLLKVLKDLRIFKFKLLAYTVNNIVQTVYEPIFMMSKGKIKLHI